MTKYPPGAKVGGCINAFRIIKKIGHNRHRNMLGIQGHIKHKAFGAIQTKHTRGKYHSCLLANIIRKEVQKCFKPVVMRQIFQEIPVLVELPGEANILKGLKLKLGTL